MNRYPFHLPMMIRCVLWETALTSMAASLALQLQNIYGILVQMPLPSHLDAIDLVNRIDPLKDVDGFTPHNQILLLQGRPGLFPCTPLGVMRLLEMNNVSLRGKHAVILGRSMIVGKPLSAMMLDANATVTVTHSHTEHLKEICQIKWWIECEDLSLIDLKLFHQLIEQLM